MISLPLYSVRPLVRMACAATALALALAAVPLRAADAAPDEVLVENAYARVTRGDFEAEMLRIPEDKRAAFRSDPKRVVGVLNNLLIVRTTAAMARSQGLEKDPAIATRMALEAERALGQAELARVEAAAAAEFDGRDAKAIEAMAREIYAADAAKYKQGPEVSASHILIDTKKRDAAAALALANEIRRRLLAGEDFAAVAKATSDDPSAKSNGGALGYFGADRMDPAFSQAAFALQKEGELSEPVLSSFGYHIIRLDGRRPATVLPYDQVKAGILKDARQRFIDSRRDEVLTKIAQDPAMKINNAAIESLVNRVAPRPEAGRGTAPATNTR
jgi:peptidyl-prolyl cis-trans isomerase C